jgi:D-lyxose ketol-isomerase
MKLSKSILVLMLGLVVMACTQQQKNIEVMKEKAPYQKKYTNADFYKDGKLDPEIALKAYLDMLEHYGVPYSDFVKNNLWITDFNLGDFENVGMAGLFWVNDPVHYYFGHEIYLLPGQMIVEHKHVATEFPAKFESWQVRHGWTYNYSVGETSPNGPKLPESQKEFITVSHFKKQLVDEVIHLAEIESPHFLFAGPEGVIVTEFASFHDGNGLRFTNPNVEFVDVLSKSE